MKLARLAAIAGAFVLGAHGAEAQQTADLNNPAPFGPPVEDEHVWVHGILDQLEGRVGDAGTNLRWMGEAWAGPDEWKVWVKSEGERTNAGRVEDGQQEIYYSKPISTYWNVQVGGRYDLDSGPGRGWGAIGIEGLAPRFFHISATAYAGEKGVAGKVEGSYDQLITNRLIFQPEAELNVYSENDPARRIGSSFSDIDAGLRLRYEITRKFAPYIGVVWEQKFGKTADLARAAGETAGDVRFAVGVRSWF
jgi:copper resistance protein B